MSQYINGLSQDGNTWTGRTMVGGKRTQKKFSLGTSEQNEQAARDWLHNQERVRAGLSPVYPIPTNLEELVNTYLESVRSRVKSITLDGYFRLLSKPLKHFGQTHSLHLNQFEIDKYAQLRQIEGAGRTIIKELNALRYALEELHLPIEWHVPRHLGRLPKKESYVPTCTDFHKLTDSLGQNARLAVLMAALAGLRNEEVYRVKWKHYSQAERLLSVPAEIRKTNQSNLVPVVDTLDRVLRREMKAIGTIIPVSKSVIRGDLQRVSKQAGIHVWTGLQPARRLLVTLAEDAGYGSDQIALVTGHARTSMPSRYSSANGRLDLKRQILEDVERRVA